MVQDQYVRRDAALLAGLADDEVEIEATLQGDQISKLIQVAGTCHEPAHQRERGVGVGIIRPNVRHPENLQCRREQGFV
jgi:hypothetical protein